MNHSAIKQGILVVLLMLAVFVAARSGAISDKLLNELLAGVAVSVLAAVFSIYFLRELSEKKGINYGEIRRIVEDVLKFRSPHFGRVDRNVDMGEQYWIDIIDKLDCSTEPCWFMGTRLSRWRSMVSYSEPLREKLIGRFKAILDESNTQKQDMEFMTYVFLTDGDAVREWKVFFQEVIDELTKNDAPERKAEVQKRCWEKIHIAELPKDLVKYAAVMCADRLNVTPYTSSGRLEESPSLDIYRNSVVWRLYNNDLGRLIGIAREKREVDSTL